MQKLEVVGTNIWLLEGDIVSFYGFAYPTRSVIIRLENNDLWVWSPVKLTEDAALAIAELGTPAHLVSPNKIHHLYLHQWKARWPDAKLWGPLSTIRKRSDLPFEPPLDEAVPPEWGNALDMVRFSGSIFMDELVFFHRSSRTCILADLSEHFSESFLLKYWKKWQLPIARLWGITVGKGYAPLEWRLSFWHRKEARKARDRILSWNADKVIMAHGEWQNQNGQAFLRKAFSWV